MYPRNVHEFALLAFIVVSPVTLTAGCHAISLRSDLGVLCGIGMITFTVLGIAVAAFETAKGRKRL